MVLKMEPIPQHTADKMSGHLKVTGMLDGFTPDTRTKGSGFQVWLELPKPRILQTAAEKIGGGLWQIKVVADANKNAAILYFSAICDSESEEKLSPTGDRIGDYAVTLGFSTHEFSDVRKSGPRRWKPSGHNKDSWCLENWIKRSNFSNPVASPNFGSSIEPNFPDSFTIFWSIENMADLLSKDLPFASIVADLFDDKDASNAVFIISHPRSNAEKEEYIYAHTKILSASSAYFKTMFESDFSEGGRSSLVSTSNGPNLGLQELLHFEDSDYEDVFSGPIENEISGKIITPIDLSKYRSVRITDTSYTTYRAMLYFLYTGSYSFAPLKSGSKSAKSISRPSHSRPTSTPTLSESSNVPTCSAKSMYRLSHRLDIAELKTAALEHIRESLTPENISNELSSPFTIRFAEIKAMEQDYFVQHWNEIKNTTKFGAFVLDLFEDRPDGAGGVWLETLRRIRAK